MADFPAIPATALVLAGAFVKLGGNFYIDSNGKRGMGRPCWFSHRVELPQLPDLHPSEQFHSLEEYEGGMKVLEALMRLLDKEDKDYIFAVHADVAVDERGFTPTISEPKRVAA